MMNSKRMILMATLIVMGVIGTGSGFAFAALPDLAAPETPYKVRTDTIELVYQFTGVSDDGEQGSLDRKEATSVLCTNIDPIEFLSVEVRVYQWNRIDVYTSTVDLAPNQSATWSTQNTGIYFEDAVLGGNPGTDPIFQGSGEILSTDPDLICTAQVLDPLNVPPEFVVGLPLFDKNGIPVGDTSDVYLPAVKKNLPTN